jgi:hypothetical protein
LRVLIESVWQAHHVRYWPKADIPNCTAHVRFWG